MRSCFVHEVVYCLEDFFCRFQQFIAPFGEFHAMGGSSEKVDAQLLLKSLYLPAHRRLTEMQIRSSFGYVPMTGYGDESLKPVNFHTILTIYLSSGEFRATRNEASGSSICLQASSIARYIGTNGNIPVQKRGKERLANFAVFPSFTARRISSGVRPVARAWIKCST